MTRVTVSSTLYGILLLYFFTFAQGGIVQADLTADIPTVRQIKFRHAPPPPFQTNEIDGGRNEVGPMAPEGSTGISCHPTGVFVSAPDGCNRCYCGRNGELTHRCTRAYCPPGFPSGSVI